MTSLSLNVLLTADPFLPVPPPLYGGIERIVHGLAQELRSRSHRVGLVAHPKSTCVTDFFRPWPSEDPGGTRNALRHALTLRSAVNEFRPDVVHSFSRLMFMLPLLRKRGAKLMSYQRATGGWRNRLAAKLGGDSFAFTGCSEFIASLGRPWGGRWLAIPNFVDVEHYRFSPQVSADAPLVFLSRIESIKGAHQAIRMASGAGRRLIIAGNRVDTPQGREYWSREIEPHLAAGRVEYVGSVDDEQKNRLLGSAAALLVPIEWEEPFGIVFAEAQACGTPVISCPRGALPEIVRDGVHGFLVRSIEEGVAVIARLPEIDRQACRRNAEERFSRRVAGDAYIALYRELIARSRA
jgi:glycosyltransferase involved in cell wall biosynthesis